MTELTLVLNFVIIFLLITAIVYGFMLSRRIRLIQQSRKELANLFRSFDDTILKAQGSVEDLKRISGAVSEGLQKKIDKAVMLMDDLAFLGEKATESADKVSKAIANFKKIENTIPASVRNKNTAAMPLVAEQPMPSKSMIPSKPSLQALKKKALEDLLDEVGGEDGKKTVRANNNNSATAKKATQEDKNVDKRQFSIASALKALGYGD